MSHGDVAPLGARVAVVSTSLDPDANELWPAARERVADLVVFGARSERSPAPWERPLREIDGGRGLIYRHLVGLRRGLRAYAPDLVHVNGETWGLTVQELLTIPVPLVVHGAENRWEHGRGLERSVRRRLVDRAVRRMSGYASWNGDGAAHVHERGRRLGRSLPTLVLPAIVPPVPFRTRAWAGPVPDGAPLEILLVGQIIAKKGFGDVVEAAARLDRPVRITLCGSGDLESGLRDQARRLGVGLRVLGWIDPTELAEEMARSHLLVQPSRTIPDWSEQFGRSVAEAMAVGLPSLVSDSGELPTVVGGDPRTIFPEGDVAALTERLRALTSTPAELTSVSQTQRELARQYEPGNASASLVTFWSEVLR